jgi:hypothetical protein
MGTDNNDSAMMKVLSWVVDVDAEAARGAVTLLRRKYPNVSNDELARKFFSGARWKATATGVATGLPANPWASVPAALVDVGAVLRIEATAASRVAVAFDDQFFTEENAEWELLVPLFGFDVASQVAREAGVRAGMAVTRQMIRTYLSKGTLKAFQRLMLKYLGIKVTQRAVITKTLPVVGGIIGGAWNFGEVTLLRNRCITYFSGRELNKVPAG